MSNTFVQITDPVWGSLALSAVVAALPLILLFILLGVFRVKAAKAALAALGLSILLAIFVWHMPWDQALSATAAGAIYGLFPILWILANALWVYKLTVATPWFEALGRTIRSISNDLRILAVLIAFCFGALLEGLAGFGAPVAITAAMLIAAGLEPLKAGVVSLLANTAPVAFGAMGAPIIALSGVTSIELHELSSMAGRQTPFIALLVPLVLVFIVDGWRGVRQTWPVALVAGGTFAVVQYITSNFLTVELTDVISALATVPVVLFMLKVWQPKELIGLGTAKENDAALVSEGASAGGPTQISTPVTGTVSSAAAKGINPVASTDTGRPSGREVWYAILPYLLIIAIFSVAQIPFVKHWLTEYGSITFHWPGLDVVNADGNAVAAQNFKFEHLKAAGTLLLLSGVLTALLYKLSFRTALRSYWETIKQLRWTIITVTTVLALSFVMNLSGQTVSLGLALAATGGFFAVLSPVIGWIGVALTGSDTSSNSLFGALQVTAAQQTGLSPVLMASANSSAGVMGKMLSVQNLAVAAAAIGLPGSEPALFRKLIGWSLFLLALLTILIVLQTGVLSWMVPQG